MCALSIKLGSCKPGARVDQGSIRMCASVIKYIHVQADKKFRSRNILDLHCNNLLIYSNQQALDIYPLEEV